MKRFLLVLLVCCSAYRITLSQDILIKRNGEQLKTRVLKVTKKEVIYKNYDDPEFTTHVINEKELDKLKPEKGREYWFNHKLPRAYIGVNFGLSSAVGSFASKSYDNASAEPGFAGIGGNFNIEGGFYLWKRLGLHFKVGASDNKFEASKLAENYKTDPSDQYTVSSDQKWSAGYLNFGPIYSIKLSKWLTWDNKIFVGMASSSKPAYYISIINNTNNTHLSISSASSDKVNGCWGIGTTFRFSPVKRIGFHLSVEYRNSNSYQNINESINGTVEGVDINNSNNGSNNPNTTTSNRNYSNSVVNITAGVAIQFNRKRR